MARYTGRLCRECRKNIVLCRNAAKAVCEECKEKAGRRFARFMRNRSGV